MSTSTSTSSASKIEANLRHICRHEAKPNPKPLPYTAVTRGFEKVAFPKIVRELGDPELIVRQKSLLAARELLATPVDAIQCIAAGITPAVVNLLIDDDAICRERAAGTLQCIAVKEVGARDIIQHGGIAQLIVCLQDKVTAVRDAAYKALIEASRFDCTRAAIIRLGSALPLLMSLVLQEQHQRSLWGLMILNACVQVRHNTDSMAQLVDTSDSIPSLCELMAAEQPQDIQEQAALLLGILTSTWEKAKLQAVRVGCIPRLLHLTRLHNVALATTATTAIMMITIANDGKYAVIKSEGGLQALVDLLDPSNEQLCVNAMECISNVAEAPEARPVIKAAGGDVKLLAIHEGKISEVLTRSAAQAIRQCRFKNWPFEPLPGRTVDPDRF